MDAAQAEHLETILKKTDSSGNPICKLFRFQDGTGSMHDSRSSMISFDMTNKFVVCIRTNPDHYTQVAAPIAIMLVTFSDTQNLEIYVDKENAETIINAALPDATEAAKEQIKKWIKTIEISNLDNPDERPYYDNVSPSIGDHNYAPKEASYIQNTDVGKQGYFDN